MSMPLKGQSSQLKWLQHQRDSGTQELMRLRWVQHLPWDLPHGHVAIGDGFPRCPAFSSNLGGRRGVDYDWWGTEGSRILGKKVNKWFNLARCNSFKYYDTFCIYTEYTVYTLKFEVEAMFLKNKVNRNTVRFLFEYI